MTVMFRQVTAGDAAEVQERLAAEGWQARVPSSERAGALIEAAHLSLGGFIDGRLVAFGRAVGDGISNGYLSMVVVHRAYRRQGIGRALVEALTSHDPDITWVLRAGDGAEFWEALGFERSQIAMERVRRRSF
jgi:ribosomal protein S18 acetylase RimI-like enzyme